MIDLSLFHNPAENIYILKKWNWDYMEAHQFQLECVDFVHENPQVCLLLLCSHPHCFTLGRGLQKIKGEKNHALVDFDRSISLAFPLHDIKRGGGLTFHYPGQVVFYPILNLTHKKLAVFDLMITILDITRNLIQDRFSFLQLEINRELLGLWSKAELSNSKIASIGLAMNRYNTYHGLALNFFNDQTMLNALKSVYPCGLPGDLYKDLELLSDQKLLMEDREMFVDQFIEKFIKYIKADQLMIERQMSSSLIKDSISKSECL